MQCPRCEAVHVVAMFVGRNDTLHAIEPPARDPPTPIAAGPAGADPQHHAQPGARPLAWSPPALSAPPPEARGDAFSANHPPLSTSPTDHLGPFPPQQHPALFSPPGPSPALEYGPAPPHHHAGPFPPAQLNVSISPAAARVSPGLVTSGLQVADAGAAAARASTSLLLNLADSVDTSLGRHRALVLATTAILGVLAHYVGSGDPQWGALRWFAGFLFVAVLALAALAFVARCRDEQTGQFSSERLSEQAGVVAGMLRGAAADLVEAPPSVRLQHCGSVAAFLGVVFAEVALLAGDTIEPWVPSTSLWVGSLGAILWSWGRSLEQAQGAPAAPAAPGSPTTTHAIARLPVVVESGGAVYATAHPLLDAVLFTLSQWRPRPFHYEKEYQASLFRALRRQHSSIHVEREVRTRDDLGGKRSVDLVLRAQGESLLLELKSAFDSNACDRATTQVAEYARLGWGPVLLVACDAPRDRPPVQRLQRSLSEQRTHGLPVAMVMIDGRAGRGQLQGPAATSAPAARPWWQVGLRRHALAAAGATLIYAWSLLSPSPPRARQVEQQPGMQPAMLVPTVTPFGSSPARPAIDPCIASTTCRDCAARSFCAWCGASERCVYVPSNRCDAPERLSCGGGWKCTSDECSGALGF